MTRCARTPSGRRVTRPGFRTSSAGRIGCAASSACVRTTSTSAYGATWLPTAAMPVIRSSHRRRRSSWGRGRSTEFFLNYGRGFHSNDARGTTINVDPIDGVSPVQPVDPLVAAGGARARAAFGRLAGAAARNVALVTGARFRAPVCRRWRRDGGQPQEPATRHRGRCLLVATGLADRRRRPGVVARPVCG